MKNFLLFLFTFLSLCPLYANKENNGSCNGRDRDYVPIHRSPTRPNTFVLSNTEDGLFIFVPDFRNEVVWVTLIEESSSETHSYTILLNNGVAMLSLELTAGDYTAIVSSGDNCYISSVTI